MSRIFHIPFVYIAFAVISTLVFIVYLNSINGKFLYDDHALITDNPAVHSISNIPHHFTFSEPVYDFVSQPGFYRPLTQSVYTTLYSIFKLDTTPYHFINIFLHILVSCIVFLIFRDLIKRDALALAGALLFSLHPVHTEIVSYISGTPDLLSAFFVFLFVYFVFRDFIFARGTYPIFIYFLIFVLGLMSKEISLVILPFTLLIALIFNRGLFESKKFRILVFGLLFIVTIYFLYTTFYLKIDRDYVSVHNEYHDSIRIRIFSFLNTLFDYFKVLISPVHLYFEKLYAVPSYLTGKALIVSTFLVLYLIYSWFSLRKFPLFLFAILFFMSALFPVSGILLPVNAIGFDHWLYIPSFGFILVVLQFVEMHYSRVGHRMCLVVLSVVLCLFSYRVFLRNREYSEPLLFFQNELSYFPNNKTYTLLGDEYLNSLQISEAISSYRKAIEVNDITPHPHNSLAQIFILSGQYEASKEEYFKALKIRSNFYPSLKGLHVIAKQMKVSDETISAYEKLLKRALEGEPIQYDEIPQF